MFDFLFGRTFGRKRHPKWRSVRRAYIKQNPVCEITGKRKKLQVHHIYPVHLFPELELDPDNLITLTKEMHLWIAHLGNYRSYNPDIRKDARFLREKIKNRP